MKPQGGCIKVLYKLQTIIKSMLQCFIHRNENFVAFTEFDSRNLKAHLDTIGYIELISCKANYAVSLCTSMELTLGNQGYRQKY